MRQEPATSPAVYRYHSLAARGQVGREMSYSGNSHNGEMRVFINKRIARAD